MKLSEEEAKTKWCPMVRLFPVKETSGKNCIDNRGSNYDLYCLSSDCMMWVWEPPIETTIIGEGYIQKGYCGLSERC